MKRYFIVFYHIQYPVTNGYNNIQDTYELVQKAYPNKFKLKRNLLGHHMFVPEHNAHAYIDNIIELTDQDYKDWVK